MAGAGPWEDYAAAATAPETEGPWSAYSTGPQPGAPRVSADLLSSIRAGLQASVSGLALRGKAPDVVTGPQTPWYDRAAASVAQMGADIPEMVAGGVLGSEIPGVGNVAGAFAVPMAMRKALMQAYQQHGVHSWEDLWGVSKQAILGLGEGALEGKLLGGATKLANIGVDAMSPLVASSGARALGPIIRGVAVSGAQSATLATAGAALEGRMPTAQDFLDSAVVIGGLHAATGIAGTLRDIYGATGRTPTQVVVDASQDSAIKDSIEKGDMPAAYQPLADAETARAAVPDPQPGVEPLKDPHIDALEIPAEGKPPSAVDTSNINSLEDLDLATERLTARYGEETQKQGRWVVPRAESMAKGAQLLSDALGATPEGGNPLPHAIEDAENAHQLWARVSLVQDTAARTKILADQIAKADPASLTPQQLSDFLAQVERTGMIGSHFMGARAEAGRALNILRSTRGLADQYQAMQDAIKQYGDTKDIQQLAKAFADSDSTASTIAA
ncbi:MAG: hypothetical protein KGL39_34670, partial [Patescibacteria group bacterium]|nr:hypothetical protein [Patescibacteria group bacterium]